MTRPLKVLQFVPAFGWGGTERQFVNLGLGLDRSRFAVSFACFRRFGVMLDELEQSRIPVLDYGVHRLRDIRVLRAQLRLARDIRSHGFDIVHTYGFHAHAFAIPAAKLAGVPVVASIRDMGVYLSPTQRRVQRWICRFADRVLVNADAIKQWLTSEGVKADRISVIPNGIDVTRFARTHSGRLHGELHLQREAPLVAVLGRVTPRKGLEDFIAAAAIVKRQFADARFLIIGEPSFTADGTNINVDYSYQNGLAQLASTLGLEESVIFTGFRSDVPQILAELAVSVLPSLSEGLSNTLLESMAAGVPTVATRVGGTPEVIRDGENGLLVAPADHVALASSICRLLEGRALATKLGDAARRTIAEQYSTAQLIERTSRFYDSVVRGTSRFAPQPETSLVGTNS